MNEYTTDIAKEILDKLNGKGWNLYKALRFEDTVDPTETIRRGPASELEKNAMYIVLPAVEDSRNPGAVQNALRGLTKKTGEHILLPHGEEGIDLQALILREHDVGVPVQKFTVGIPYASFVDQLDRLYDTHLKTQINYANIASPLRTLVQKLNDIPFVYTLKSKAGQIADVMNRNLSQNPLSPEELKNPHTKLSIIPDENHAFVTGGYVCFKITEEISDPAVGAFMQDIFALEERYSFVKIKGNGSEMTITLDSKDMTDAHEVKKEDDFETRVKKLHQASKKQAEKRIKEFLDVRDELTEIAERYSSKEE